MINIQDIHYSPSIEECSSLIQDSLFDELIEHLKSEYEANYKIEYSKDALYKGWNIKFRKSGKALCTLYPKEGSFTLLVVVSNAEKALAEQILPSLSQKTQTLYHQTKEGMGQRWLMIKIDPDTYQDALRLIEIRWLTRKHTK